MGGDDPLRTGAIFRVDPSHPALRSPVPRLHAAGRATGGPVATAQLHRPNPQRAASSATRTSFEELYRQSPMPKVIAAGGRMVRPSPNRTRPSVPAFDASPRGAVGVGSGTGTSGIGGASPADARAVPKKRTPVASQSPATSRSSQTSSTTLVEWSVRRVASEGDTASEHFVVQGIDTRASDAGLRVSSPIAVRAAPRQLMTESENIYKLEGRPEQGVMAEVAQSAFANGLTKDWKTLLGGSAGARTQSAQDEAQESVLDHENVSPAPVSKGPNRKTIDSHSKSKDQLKSSPRPPTEAEARAKAREIAAAQSNAARQARFTTAAQQRQATSSVMSSFDDVEPSVRRRSSRTSEDNTSPTARDTRRKSLIVTKKGRAPPPAPAPAPKPRRQIPAAVARAAERAAEKAEEEAAAAEVLKLDEMPVTSSGRRRVPPLPFWANSTIRRDRDFNVLSATSGREVLLTAGAKDERTVLQPGAVAAAAVLPRPTTDLQERVEEAAATSASKPKERSSSASSSGSHSTRSPIKHKSRRSSTDGSSKKSKKRKKEKRNHKKDKGHRARADDPYHEDTEDVQVGGIEGTADPEDGQGAAVTSSNSVSSGMSSIKFMSVKELKAQLDEKGVDHSACIEKQDLVDLLRLYWGVVISKPNPARGKRSKTKAKTKTPLAGPSKRIRKGKKAKPVAKAAKRRKPTDGATDEHGMEHEMALDSQQQAGELIGQRDGRSAADRRVKKISNKAKAAASADAAAATTTEIDSATEYAGGQHEDDDAVVPDSEEEEGIAGSSVIQADPRADRPQPTQSTIAASTEGLSGVEMQEDTEVEALKQQYFRVLGKKPRGRFQNSTEWLMKKLKEANTQSPQAKPAEPTSQDLSSRSDSGATVSPALDTRANDPASPAAASRPRRTPSKPARFKTDDDVVTQGSRATSSVEHPAEACSDDPVGWSTGAQHALSAAFASTAPTRPNFWGAVSDKLAASGHKFSAAECQAQYDARFGSPQAASFANKKNQPASSSKKRRGKRGADVEDDSTVSSFGSFIAAASEKAAEATKPPPRKGTMANRRRLRGMLEDADAAHDGDDLFNSPRALGRDGFIQKDDSDRDRGGTCGLGQIAQPGNDPDHQTEGDENVDQGEEEKLLARPRRSVGAPTRFADENIPTSRNWRELRAQKEAEEAAAAEAARLSTRSRPKTVDDLLSKSPVFTRGASGSSTSTSTSPAVASPGMSSTNEKKVAQLQKQYEETLGKSPRGKLARNEKWLKEAITSASESAVRSGDSSPGSKRAPGRQARSSPGGTPKTRGNLGAAGSGSGKKRRRLSESAIENDTAEDEQEHKKLATTKESRLARGCRFANAAAAVEAVAAAGTNTAGALSGSPDILKPVDNEEREHLDPYIAKLQKRQRQQQRRPAAQKAADKKAAERKAAVEAELALAKRPSRRLSSPKRFDQEEILSSHEAAKRGLSPWPQSKRSRASVGSLASSDDSDED